MQAPKKISLASQAADILREQIQHKKFVKILPGETPLAANLHVSRKTVREALVILENEKLISAPEAGKRREILTVDQGSEDSNVAVLDTVRILIPLPIKQMHASAQHFFRSYCQYLGIDEDDVEYHSMPYASPKIDVSPRIAELVESHPAALWVVWEITAEVADVMENLEQNVIACGGISNIDIPVVSYHSPSALMHAQHKLIQQGHSRIVRPLNHLKADSSAMTKVLMEANINVDKEFHFPYYKGDSKSLSEMLTRLFSNENPPTAFITAGPNQLIFLITWLASIKLSVPEDISILHIGSDPLLESIYPRISHYSTSSGPLARELARLSQILLNSPRKKMPHKYFYMEYEAGDSLSKAST